MREKNSSIKGKVWCLIDTDSTRHKEHISDGTKNLKIRRLSNKNLNTKTELLTLKHSDTSTTDVEQTLNPLIFKKTIDALEVDDKYKITNIENESGNTDFIKNFKNLDIENYFKENDGNNKIVFAQKYVEMMVLEADVHQFIPSWIDEIRKYFEED